jgi:hypothetical protein
MSVEYCVLRVAPRMVEELRQQPSILQDIMDAFYTSSPDASQEQQHVDSRDVYRGLRRSVPSVFRMLYMDEFTTSLLVDFMDESSAFFAALVGWGSADRLEGVSYGYGDISFYAPQQASVIALELNATSNALLVGRFHEHASDFRLASSGYFADDQAILEHQSRFADLLRRFYTEAAHDGDSVLLLVV